MGCIFCDIVSGKLPAEVVYEDGDVLVFKDLNPAAPVHLLIIPKKHIENLSKVEEEDFVLIGKIFRVIKKIEKDLNLSDGFRVVSNCKKDGGQTVMHVHFHFLAKREMGWPPG